MDHRAVFLRRMTWLNASGTEPWRRARHPPTRVGFITCGSQRHRIGACRFLPIPPPVRWGAASRLIEHRRDYSRYRQVHSMARGLRQPGTCPRPQRQTPDMAEAPKHTAPRGLYWEGTAGSHQSGGRAMADRAAPIVLVNWSHTRPVTGISDISGIYRKKVGAPFRGAHLRRTTPTCATGCRPART